MRPNYLQPNDTIGIIATARHISQEEISPTVDFLQSHNFQVELGKNLYKQFHQYAGTDQERAADLQYMLDAPHIKAILCARGGYGTARIIDKIDFSHFLQSPKWICGYSDITVLHAHIHHQFQIPTLHSFMPINFINKNEMQQESETFLHAITGKSLQYHLQNHPLNREGNGEGVIIGGNLSVLYSLIGSPSDIDTTNKILFLEDLDEYLYHIDRMLLNLKRNNKLEKLAGLIVGSFSDMHDNTISFGKSAEEIIAESCAEYHFPISFNFPAGHVPPNCSLKFGEKISFNVSKKNGVNITYI